MAEVITEAIPLVLVIILATGFLVWNNNHAATKLVKILCARIAGRTSYKAAWKEVMKTREVVE